MAHPIGLSTLALAAATALAFAPGPALACDSEPVDILFAFGSDRLSPADARLIAAQAQELHFLGPGSRIRLTAHADRTGDGWANLRMSQRRAEAVLRVLAASGVEASRVDVMSRGEAVLPVPTPDGRPEPRNRVVNVAAFAASQVARENPVPGCAGFSAP